MRFVTKVCLSLLLAAATTACVSPVDQQIEEMVRSAASAEDHLRIAAYYREQAAEVRDAAVEHERLVGVYSGRQNWGVDFSGRVREHCSNLSSASEELAASYEMLATDHEQLAGE